MMKKVVERKRLLILNYQTHRPRKAKSLEAARV